MGTVKDARKKLPVNYVLDGRWKITKVLGEGAFGAVYEVSDMEKPGKLFALKIESNQHRPGDPPKMLPLEVTVLRSLRDIGAKYFPGYESCGQNERFNYVVMGLVGKNVNDLRKSMPNKRFTLRSCLHLADKSILSLDELHMAGFLHRDLKPANMCIGRAPYDLRSVYILDWGLCRRYVNERGEVHRPRERVGFRGTPWYASMTAMYDADQGRVDDMWSWFFSIVELTVGGLPWDDGEKPPSDRNKYLKWLRKKKEAGTTTAEVLCQGCPREFNDIYDYFASLAYQDKPDCSVVVGCLQAVMQRKGFVRSKPLDWEPEGENNEIAASVPNATMLHEAGAGAAQGSQ